MLKDHSVDFLIDICDIFKYISKSGNQDEISREDASSHEWKKLNPGRGFTYKQWQAKYKCKHCNANMAIFANILDEKDEDMVIILRGNRRCLTKEDRIIKDVIE